MAEQWAAEAFGVDVQDVLEEAAAVPVGAAGVIALPYLLGERAPWWDADATSAVIDLAARARARGGHPCPGGGRGAAVALVLDAVRSVADVDAVRVTGSTFRSDRGRPSWASALAWSWN